MPLPLIIASLALAEPAVALSDFALAVVAAGCAALIARSPSADATLRREFAAFFATLAASALLGGLDHGFFRPGNGAAHAIAWPLTLLLIGIAGALAAVIAARLSLPSRGARIAAGAAALLLIPYAGRIALGAREFSLAIAAYLLPALWLLAMLLWQGWPAGRPGALPAAGGVALILAGSAVQHFGISLGPDWLGADTLYHLIAMAGVILLSAGARRLLAGPSTALPTTPAA